MARNVFVENRSQVHQALVRLILEHDLHVWQNQVGDIVVRGPGIRLRVPYKKQLEWSLQDYEWQMVELVAKGIMVSKSHPELLDGVK